MYTQQTDMRVLQHNRTEGAHTNKQVERSKMLIEHVPIYITTGQRIPQDAIYIKKDKLDHTTTTATACKHTTNKTASQLKLEPAS
jgi:hypothetical protein